MGPGSTVTQVHDTAGEGSPHDASRVAAPVREGHDDRRMECAPDAAGEERAPEEAGYGYGV